MAIEYTFQLCTASPVDAVRRLLVQEVSTGLRVTVHRDGRANLVLVEPEISVGFRQQDFERILLLWPFERGATMACPED